MLQSLLCNVGKGKVFQVLKTLQLSQRKSTPVGKWFPLLTDIVVVSGSAQEGKEEKTFNICLRRITVPLFCILQIDVEMCLFPGSNER